METSMSPLDVAFHGNPQGGECNRAPPPASKSPD